MPFFIISVIIQVAFVIHVVKTGRNTMWIWIIVMLPLAGSIAYFIVEIFPEIRGSKTGIKTQKRFKNALNPNKDLNQAVTNFSSSDTVENSMNLAGEMMKKGMYQDARELYQRCLRGLHEHDPDIMSKLAQSEFELGYYRETKQTLDELIAVNPDYKNADSHLLYARALEALKDYDSAIEEYEVLANYYVGPEAAYRYAMLCKQLGNAEKADDLLQSIIQKSNASGSHYKTLHKEWINKTKSALKK